MLNDSFSFVFYHETKKAVIDEVWNTEKVNKFDKLWFEKFEMLHFIVSFQIFTYQDINWSQSYCWTVKDSYASNFEIQLYFRFKSCKLEWIQDSEQRVPEESEYWENSSWLKSLGW